MRSPPKLNRYVSLPVLLDIIKREKIVFSNPSRWEDKNDVEVINEYKRRTGLKTVFVICFCRASETNLFWSAYAGDAMGCCVEFDRRKLLKCFPENTEVNGGRFRHYIVKYKTRKYLARITIPTNKFPFYKRHAYRGEAEYRLLWESQTKRRKMEVTIPLGSIRRVTLSAHLPPEIYQLTKKLIKSIAGESIHVNQSTVYKNKEWINRFKTMPDT